MARLQRSDGHGPAGPAPAPRGPSRRPIADVLRRLAAGLWRLAAGLWRDHRLITVAAALSLLPRVLAMAAFRPALFTPDSFGYLAEGVHLSPGSTRPAGYPVLLRALEPFHSLALITSVQHLMGIATAVIGYAVLRRWGLPAWGAVLAACPTMFDSRQIMLESAILPDTLYTLLLMLAVALLLTRRRPTPRRCAAAGLLLAWASLARGNGAPELAGVLAVLAVQRAGWRRVAAAAAAFAIPVLAYMAVFDLNFGTFSITNSDGLFLWSRTMSFADCAVIKPPPALRPLCPDRQPGHPAHATPAWSVPAILTARTPAAYLWAPGAWWRHDAHPGINAANNALATAFALDALRAQPGAYLRTVASGVMQTFLTTDRAVTARTLHFTAVPDVPRLRGAQIRHLREYAHTTGDTRPAQPYAYFLYLYQEPVYFPGVVFGLVLVAGLIGVARRWRQPGGTGGWRPRGGPAALPWAVALIGVVAPVALHEAHYRYAIPAVPVACLAAGLAFARRPGGAPQAAVEQAAGTAGRVVVPAVPAQPPSAPPARAFEVMAEAAAPPDPGDAGLTADRPG